MVAPGVCTTMSETIPAHGGTLIDRFVPAAEQAEARAHARTLPQLPLTRRQVSDLELIAIGAASPLTGFLGRADYESVVRTMHLSNGLPWSIPLTLDVAPSDAERLQSGQRSEERR